MLQNITEPLSDLENGQKCSSRQIKHLVKIMHTTFNALAEAV